VKISEVKANKRAYINLLLLTNKQENMIDHYLEKGTIYVLDDKGVKAKCVMTDDGMSDCSSTKMPAYGLWGTPDTLY